MENAQDIFSEVWDTTQSIWQHGFMGINVGTLIVGICIFLAFLVIRDLFTRHVLDKLYELSKKTTNNLDDRLINAIVPPIRFLPIVLGIFFAGYYMNADEILGDFFPKVTRSLVAFTLFWGMHRATRPLSSGVNALNNLLSPLLVHWLFRIARTLIIFLGGAIILEIWGIQVAPLLAGLGLFGAAIALGAQDLFKNLIGGITIIAEKRFEPGDYINVEGVIEGIVEDINFRSTLVRRFDKAPVHVPNTLLADSVVINYSRRTHRQIEWYIGVTYSTTKEQLKLIRDKIFEFIKDSDDFANPEDERTCVHVNRFDDSSITFLIYCYTITTTFEDFLAVQEKLAYAVKDIVEDQAGADFAFPSQSLYVETIPDILKPASAKKPTKTKTK